MHDISILPYHTGNGLVDTVLFVVFGVLFGLAMGWGWRVANKLP